MGAPFRKIHVQSRVSRATIEHRLKESGRSFLCVGLGYLISVAGTCVSDNHSYMGLTSRKSVRLDVCRLTST